MNIIQKPSPNWSNTSYKKDLIILHKTLGSHPGDLNWLTKSGSGVSANYLINREGQIFQLVPDNKMAWHSGRIIDPSDLAKQILKKYAWGTYINPNKYSIGIELSGMGTQEFTSSQEDSCVWLCKNIGITTILTHKEITVYKPDITPFRDIVLNRIKQPESGDVNTQIQKLKDVISYLGGG